MIYDLGNTPGGGGGDGTSSLLRNGKRKGGRGCSAVTPTTRRQTLSYFGGVKTEKKDHLEHFENRSEDDRSGSWTDEWFPAVFGGQSGLFGLSFSSSFQFNSSHLSGTNRVSDLLNALELEENVFLIFSLTFMLIYLIFLKMLCNWVHLVLLLHVILFKLVKWSFCKRLLYFKMS